MELVVEAPLIARSRRAGHFVIVRADEQGERIPLTIADSDIRKGTITLVIQQVGVSTHKICSKAVGEYLQDVVGPLGKATDIRHFGTVVCACGGVGAAPMLPIARALREAGNKVITVLAARTKELIILEEQLRECSDEVIVMTDDGSYGQKGLVTNIDEYLLKIQTYENEMEEGWEDNIISLYEKCIDLGRNRIGTERACAARAV